MASCPQMPWHPTLAGKAVHLLHEADGEGPLWSGEVEIWRGTPSATDHPEIEHAFLGIGNPAIHRDFIRHRWTWEIPDWWEGYKNFGEGRRYLILRASGGVMNWTLCLKLPPLTPRFVYKAIARAFHAEPVPQKAPAPKITPRRCRSTPAAAHP
jgi:hypothetical protein